jgi:hypothetical protein
VGVATNSTFGNKLSRGSCRERHCHKPWFDTALNIKKENLKIYQKGK